MSETILRPKWMWTGGDSPALLEDHYLKIRDGRIEGIYSPEEFSPDEKMVESMPETLLLPGLINSHTHAAMSLLRCVGSDLSTLDWLQKAIWPAEGKLMSPEFVHDGSILGAYEMLSAGVTCCQDMYFFPEDAAQAMAEMGMRVVAGGLIIGFPSAQAKSEEDYFEQAKKWFFKYQNNPLITFNIAPHAPYSVSREMLRKSMAFAIENGAKWQIHVSETKEEVENSLKAHGLTPVEYLDSIGCLNSSSICVHCVHLTDHDIELLVKRGASVVHCPTSNLKLGCGIARVPDLIDAGVNVAIGTDGCASGHNLDVLGELRMAGLLAKGNSQDPTALPLNTLLSMATKNAARALGLENKTGSLKAGMDADLAAVRLSDYNIQPCYEPIPSAVYCAGPESVASVFVRGQRVAKRQPVKTELPKWRVAVSKCNLRSWQNKVCEILQSD